jgi:hypothetical protein
MSVSQNFPNIAPSLTLDFANVKALDSRVTFARASSARYYNGVTTTKAEQNLLTNSQNIANGVGFWAASGSTITANSATAPNGTSTASTVVTTGTGGVRFNFTVSVGTYTVSAWVRSVSGNTSFQTDFENGNVGSLTLTSDWQRHVSTQTLSASKAWIDFQINGAGTFEIWGAQLEQRSQVTAYQVTTTQPITNYIPTLLTATDNVARFDHNPTTGESLGLLVEELRTNLLLRSEEFDNASWTKTRSSITANTIVAPDGTLTGDKLIEDTTASNTHRLSQAVTVAAIAYTLSFYAKAAERNWIKVISAALTGVNFDLAAGTVGIANSGNTGVITPVGNGWYRCAVTFTPASGSRDVGIELASGNNVTSYTGDGYSGIYIWGAQLEAGAFPTSYIPTVASQVTRSADAASMTGANFSSWYRQDEGTIYGDFNARSPTNYRVLVGNNNSWYLGVPGSGQVSAVSDAGNILISLGVAVANTSYKISFAQKVNDSAASLNAGAVVTDTSSTAILATFMQIGGDNLVGGTGRFINGTIKKLAYYPKRLSNTELQALTS